MTRFFVHPTIIVILLLALGSTEAHANVFYDRFHEGWFWYQDPEPEDVEPEEPKPEPVTELPPPEMTEEQDTQPPGPAPMTVAWFRENHDKFLHRAIDDPTDENIKAYHILHNAMMDKVRSFADQAQRVGWQNGAFEAASRRPSTARTNVQRQSAYRELTQTAFDNIQTQGGGIWFFHDEGLQSKNMAEDLRRFGRRHDVDMIAFSMGEGILPESYRQAFSDIRLNEGQAQAAGVTHAPAVVIALPPDKLHILAHGSVSSTKIQQRIVKMGPRMGVLTQEQADMANSVISDAPRIKASDFESIEEPSAERMLELFHESQAR